MENEMEAENINAGDCFRRLTEDYGNSSPERSVHVWGVDCKLSSSSCAVVKEQKSS